MNDDLPKKVNVTVDHDLMDDECIDYLVTVPVSSSWFHKLEDETLDIPTESWDDIAQSLGYTTIDAIHNINKGFTADDIDIANAYHLLISLGYKVTDGSK